MNCKCGRSEALENYRVLALFVKYYNTWFVAQMEHFPWKNDPLDVKIKSARVLVRMTKKRDGSYTEE